MASIMLTDLAQNDDLDLEAMRSLRGAAGEGNWVLGAFPVYAPPVAVAGATEVFNLDVYKRQSLGSADLTL